MTHPTLVGRGRPVMRRAFLAITTALCTGLAAPAWSQTPTPTQVDTVDENGVDLLAGYYSPQDGGEDIGVGSGEFPSRLSLSRSATSSNGGSIIDGSNLSIQISAATSLQSEQYGVTVTIGRIKRNFWASQNAEVPGAKFVPTDGSGGFVTKFLNGQVTTYKYTSSTGEELLFSVSNITVCGKYANIDNVNSINCSRLSKWTAANGVTADFSYNVRSYNTTDLARVSNSLGMSLTFTYTRFKDSGKYTDPAFGVTSVLASSDQLGSCGAQAACSRTASYLYAVSPPVDSNVLDTTQIFPTSFTDPNGGTTQYLYTGLTTQHYPVLKSIRTPGHQTDAITINRPAVAGAPLEVMDATGRAWTYTRTSTNNGTTATRMDPLGKSRTYAFNSTGRLTRFSNELSQVTQWEYDPQGRTVKTTLPSGLVTAPTYDSRGNLLSTTVKASPPGSAPDIVGSAQFSSDCNNPKTCNQPLSVTDARGNTTDYTYDQTHGGVLTVTAPPAENGVRPQTRYTYDVVSGAYALTGASTCLATASCAGTADESKVALQYGANGLLPTAKITQAGDGSAQSSVNYTYDAMGNLVKEDGPLSGDADSIYRRYDQLDRIVGEIRPDPDGTGPLKRTATRLVYDAAGNLTNTQIGVVGGVSDTNWAEFEPKQALTSAYDLADRKTADVVAANGTTYGVAQYSYDAASRLDCRAVRMNSDAWTSLPASACDAQVVGNAGSDRITRYGYDALDRVTKVTSAYGTAAQSDEVKTAYTGDGQVATQTDANGNVTAYDYDGFDRLLKTTYSGSSYEQLGYDAAGNVISRRLRDGQVIGYGYDALGRLTTKDRPNGAYGETDQAWSYDLLGHLTSARDSNGHNLTFSYDALGRRTAQGDALYAMGRAQMQYDAAGRRTRMTWADGFYVTYEYDVTGASTAIRENGAGLLATFGYDDLGRRTSLTRGNGVTTSYGYDAASRLSSLGHDLAGTAQDLNLAFSYNPAGQVAGRTASNPLYAWAGAWNYNRNYAVNALNQYTGAGTASPDYDGRGNLTSFGSSTYGYTADNQLATAQGGNLAFDALGRLTNENVGSASTTLSYDGTDVIAETDQNTGALLRRYVHGPGTDEPLVWYEWAGTGDKRWLIADELGSVIAVTDASGQATTINTYDEFGTPGLNNQGRFRYTGQKWLPALDVYDYKNRMYSPKLGRFMQADPIGYGDGMNLYDYVGSDPVNATDPSGLAGCPPAAPGEVVVCGKRLKKTSPGSNTATGLGGSVFQDYGGRGALLALFRNAPINQRKGAASGLLQIVKDTAKKVTCAVGTAFDAASFALGAAGDAIDTALDAVHDVVFPPACAGPCVTPGQARQALNNREFRRWFHQVYKQQQGFSGGGRNNPDMSPADVMDAYGEWQQNQKKPKPRC